jgi:type II secretory pathway component PulF
MAFKLSDIPDSPNVAFDKEKESIWEKDIINLSPAFSKKQKETFYLELGILLDSGIALREALELVQQGIKKKKAKTIIGKIVDEIIEGNSLSSGFEKQKEFTNYEIQSIRIGEETGKLQNVIKNLASYFKQHNQQKKELLNALTYPIIVLLTAVIVVYFMLNFVVPIFQDLFQRNNTELPWITQVVINTSDFLNAYALWMLIAVLSFIILNRLLNSNENVQKWKGIVLMNIPWINKLVIQSYISRFINAMSLLSSAKVNITQSLQLITNMIPFYPLNNALTQINTDLINGDTQSQAFKKHPKLFDNKLIAMIQVAEQTNQDELVYENLKQHYSNLLNQQAKTFTNFINPILTLIVGFIVGFILIALYLPMFKMSTLIN